MILKDSFKKTWWVKKHGSLTKPTILISKSTLLEEGLGLDWVNPHEIVEGNYPGRVTA